MRLKLIYILPLLGFGLLLCSLLSTVNCIGYTHDELWDYYSAVRIYCHSYPYSYFVAGPYHGALKFWVTVPLLNIMNTSAFQLRFLNIVFAFIYLICMYWAVKPFLKKEHAAIVFLIPFIDRSFLLLAPFDIGPFIFQYIFLAIALGALIRMILSYNKRYVYLGAFACGALLAQKLTAIPVVMGLLVFVVAMLIQKQYQLRKKGRILMGLIKVGLFFILPLIPHIIYLLQKGVADLLEMSAWTESSSYLERLFRNFQWLAHSTEGFYFLRFLGNISLDKLPLYKNEYFFFLILYVIIIYIVFEIFRYKMQYFRIYVTKKVKVFCLLVGILVIGFLLFPLFAGLYRPWHLFILNPLLIMVVVFGLWLVVDKRKYFLYIIFIYSLYSSIISINMLYQLNKGKCDVLTSPIIFNVYNKLQTQGIKKVICLNYSIANPIYVLSKGQISADDLAWSALTGPVIASIRMALNDKTMALIYRISNCKQADAVWLDSINRRKDIEKINKDIETKMVNLHKAYFSDSKGTVFYVISLK